MATKIYNCGTSAYRIAKRGEGAKARGGSLRPDAVTAAQLEQVHRMFDPDNDDGLPLETGFACAHGRQGKYPLDAVSWEDVYKFYTDFEPEQTQISKMAKITFYKYAKVIERDFHLKRVKTDACDVCERIRVELLDQDLTSDERARIEDELKDHQQRTRAQRIGLKEYLRLWGRKEGKALLSDKLAEWDAAVDRLPDIYNDSEEAEQPRPLSALDRDMLVFLQCQDYAGNFPMPSLGCIVPGSEYYASKLHLYCMIMSDLHTGMNKAYVYDQRDMGKGVDALCSLKKKYSRWWA
jgi:hypothetical protein